ncbi:MAG: sigma-E factor negative regulatory protein [Caldimonas sp.]
MAIDPVGDLAKERLSALADGELDAAGAASSCRAWVESRELRDDWHAWHLIGDVLRSDDLASEPGRDERFRAALRSRLGSEPVVLAPAALPSAPAAHFERPAQRRAWAAGALAAGVVLVAGTFAVVRPGDSPLPSRLALGGPAPAAAPGVSGAPAPEATIQPAAIVADSKLIRDAQLDRYLEAHKQFSGTSALGVPSAFLRSATVDSAAR